MTEEPRIGERRRRREAERAAARHAGEQPITRRELRAREEALRTGAIEIDATGEVRVVDESTRSQTSAQTPASPSSPSSPAPVPEPAPSVRSAESTGLTRRQLRELRERQAAEEAARARALSSGQETPARGIVQQPGVVPAPAAPTPPVRRPVVRPPAAAGGVRSLEPDGTGLTPVVRGHSRADDTEPGSAADWSAAPEATIDVTAGTQPAAAPPVTRRSRREKVADRQQPVESAEPAPSIDEVISGEPEEPAPFSGRPSWAELPPKTPIGGVRDVAAEQGGRPEEPAGAESTEVMSPAQETVEEPEPSSSVAALAEVADDGRDEDDLDLDEDDHTTPRWLTALMWVVLIVIGIVLGLLVWRLMIARDDASAAAVTAVQGLLETTTGAL